MNFNKLSMGVALFATFGLVACGDDSSSSGPKEESISCKVQSMDPFNMVMNVEGTTVVTTILRKNGEVITTEVLTAPSSRMAKEACEDAKNDAAKEDNVTVSCEGNKVTTVEVEEDDEFIYDINVKLSKSLCQSFSDEDFDDEDDDEDEDEPKSSSSTKTGDDSESEDSEGEDLENADSSSSKDDDVFEDISGSNREEIGSVEPDYCKVISEEPLQVEMRLDGQVGTVTTDLTDEGIKTTLESTFSDKKSFDEACAEAKAEAEEGDEVTCKNDKVTVVSISEGGELEYTIAVAFGKKSCESMNDGSQEFEEDDWDDDIDSDFGVVPPKKTCDFDVDDDEWKIVIEDDDMLLITTYTFDGDMFTVKNSMKFGDMEIPMDPSPAQEVEDRDILYKSVKAACAE